MPSSETTAIETAIRDYIEGWYRGDPARVARALHDDLAKRTLADPSDRTSAELRAVTKQQMAELTRAGGGESPEAPYEITIHHVAGRLASAHLYSLEYIDFLHLVATDEGWKIANILFGARD